MNAFGLYAMFKFKDANCVAPWDIAYVAERTETVVMSTPSHTLLA